MIDEKKKGEKRSGECDVDGRFFLAKRSIDRIARANLYNAARKFANVNIARDYCNSRLLSRVVGEALSVNSRSIAVKSHREERLRAPRERGNMYRIIQTAD